MVSRPAFLDRFLARIPDVSSLRFRVLAGAGGMAGLFGLLLALATVQLDTRRCAEVARTRAETLALTAGRWLDGDAHAGLGAEPEKRLEDLAATLTKLLAVDGYPGEVRTLRPKPEATTALAAHPSSPRPDALEVVLQTGASAVREDVDYVAAMEAALFEGEVTSVVADGFVSAYAPVPDAWGATPALVWVHAPAAAPLWRRVLFGLGALLFASLLVAFAVWLAQRAAERLALQIATLESGVRLLAGGHPSSPFALAGASSELAQLADSLESLRQRLEAQAGGQPLPVSASPAEAARTEALGEASEFDLALLLQQVVEPARKLAQNRGVDLQLFVPDGVPSQLVGHPVTLFRALDALVRRALRETSQGSVTLRVTRAGSGARGEKLRFEVADTSPGIPFKDQQELALRLASAAQADPGQLKDPLEAASALAAQLGGELGFETQPGQGSRFGFTLEVQLNGPAPVTGFHARAANGFPASAQTGFTPKPQTGFQPRPQTGFHPQQTKASAAPPPPSAPMRLASGFPQPAPAPAPKTAFQQRPALPLGPPQSSFSPRPKLRHR